MWEGVQQILDQGNRFLITTHLHPDGDGVGSATALIELLRHQKKEVLFVPPSPVPQKLQFLDFHSLFRPFASLEESLPLDALIVVDTHRKSRIGRVAELLSQREIPVVCIDHHPEVQSNDSLLSPISVLDPTSCSAGAMIYSLFQAYGVSLNLQAAKGIYASVVSDTRHLSNQSTTRKTYRVAEACLQAGVCPSSIYTQLYRQVPFHQALLFQRAMSTMEFHFDRKLVLQQIRYDDYADLGEEGLEDLNPLHEFNQSIEGAFYSAILWELPEGTVRVSLRSHGKKGILQCMKELGGGGHTYAAGTFLLPPFEEAKKVLLKNLACHLSEN